jgi:uncharacterized membrane protein YkgB
MIFSLAAVTERKILTPLKSGLTSNPSFDNFHPQENFSKGVMMVLNVLGIIIGIVVIIVGLILLVGWWFSFVVVFKGILPVLLILIGVGVLIYFISETKSKLEIGKEETSASGEKKPEEK